jgi:hypothetical protein
MAFFLLWFSYAGADDDLYERDRRDLEGRKQKAEGCEQGDEYRCHIITAEFDHQV